MMNETITKRKCPSCGKQKILSDENTGELFCGSCGFVITEKIEDTGAEWRSFSQDEGNRARTGAGTSITMHDMGLSTVIGSVNKDATGKPLSASMRSSIERLRTWDSRTQAHSSSDRNLRQALSEMDKIKDKLALTNAVIEKAAYIYRKAMEKKLIRGRSIHGLVAACIYAACRNTETPRTLDDIAIAGNVERRTLSRDLRTLIKTLNLTLEQYDTAAFIVRLANNMNLKEKTKRDALSILTRSENEEITAGKHPMAQAAASLYISCIMNGEKLSQKKFSEVAGVSDVTIRNRTTLIRKVLKLSNQF